MVLDVKKIKKQRSSGRKRKPVWSQKVFIRKQSVSIASISLKKEEQGILALAADWNIPFCTFGEAELQNAKGTFEESEFVKKITGVGNVCERSAVLGAEQGTDKKENRA